MPGPVPKRSDERTRSDYPGEERMPIKRGHARGYKTWPSADKEWPSQVRQLWDSMSKSGINNFFEESDIAFLRIAADGLADWYAKPVGQRSAMKLDVAMKHLNSLGVSEGERRRMRIELEVPEIPEESVGSKAASSLRAQLGKPATVTRIYADEEEDVK